MSFLMVLRVALKALARNKMRTALTMLGMIIGVSAVITLVGIGNGAQARIEAQIKAGGTNLVTINAGNFTANGVRGGSETGAFWAVVVAAFLHIASGAVALRAWWEHRTIGRWPYGRRRATCGFFLNVAALLAIAAYFHLCANPKLFKRIFE